MRREAGLKVNNHIGAGARAPASAGASGKDEYPSQSIRKMGWLIVSAG